MEINALYNIDEKPLVNENINTKFYKIITENYKEYALHIDYALHTSYIITILENYNFLKHNGIKYYISHNVLGQALFIVLSYNKDYLLVQEINPFMYKNNNKWVTEKKNKYNIIPCNSYRK